MRNVLFIIDPQNDFVDPKGSLYIPGAEKAIDEICKVIENENPRNIIITQDTHQAYHIGHPGYWKNNPTPFTKITLEDINLGKYEPKYSYSKKNIINYINDLPDKTHTIWPEHCIEGSWGWAFPEKLINALKKWQLKNSGKSYKIIQKGFDIHHEMYSAFTRIDNRGMNLKSNTNLKMLSRFDKIMVSGFAKDVCVAWSVVDMYASGMFFNKLEFLNNCMTELNPKSELLDIFETCIKDQGAIWK